MEEGNQTVPPLGDRCSCVRPPEMLEVVQSWTLLHTRVKKKVARPYCPGRTDLAKRRGVLAPTTCQDSSAVAELVSATSLVAISDSTSEMFQRTSIKSASAGKQAACVLKSSHASPARLHRISGPLSVGDVRSTTNSVLFEAVCPATLTALTVALYLMPCCIVPIIAAGSAAYSLVVALLCHSTSDVTECITATVYVPMPLQLSAKPDHEINDGEDVPMVVTAFPKLSTTMTLPPVGASQHSMAPLDATVRCSPAQLVARTATYTMELQGRSSPSPCQVTLLLTETNGCS